MNFWTRITPIVFGLSLLPHMAVADTKPAAPAAVGPIVEDFQLTATLQPATNGMTSPLVLHLSLRNVGKETLQFYGEGFPTSDFVVTVRDTDGHKVRETLFGKAQVEVRKTHFGLGPRDVYPGTSMEKDFPLGQWYDLSKEGQYQAEVTTRVPVKAARGVKVISSGVLEFSTAHLKMQPEAIRVDAMTGNVAENAKTPFSASLKNNEVTLRLRNRSGQDITLTRQNWIRALGFKVNNIRGNTIQRTEYGESFQANVKDESSLTVPANGTLVVHVIPQRLFDLSWDGKYRIEGAVDPRGLGLKERALLPNLLFIELVKNGTSLHIE